MCLEAMPERLALNKLKQLIGQFQIGLPGSAALRGRVQQSRSVEEARAHLDSFFAAYARAAELTCI
jgi:hypothetical protein